MCAHIRMRWHVATIDSASFTLLTKRPTDEEVSIRKFLLFSFHFTYFFYRFDDLLNAFISKLFLTVGRRVDGKFKLEMKLIY